MVKKTLWLSGISLVVGFYTTFVLQNLWNWFAVPALHVSNIGYWSMFGLNILIGLLFERGEKYEEDHRWKAAMTVLDACVPEGRHAYVHTGELEARNRVRDVDWRRDHGVGQDRGQYMYPRNCVGDLHGYGIDAPPLKRSINLRIDESADRGKFASTKNRKTRYAPIPASLRAELDEWLSARADAPDTLFFTAPHGGMIYHSGWGRSILENARTAAKIPDLTFRMCRTTFTTLFNGDIKDAQEILGHHSTQFTLDTYREVGSTRAAAGVEEMDKRLSRIVPIRQTA
jgi:integrase